MKMIYHKAGVMDLFTTEKITIGESVKRLAKLPLHHEPGAKFTYSEGLDVLGYLVEIISQKPFDVFLKERIFDPLGMNDTRYVEPTGLSSQNQSSAQDLATLVIAAHGDATLRELSTSTGYSVEVGRKTLQYNNTNRLVKSPDWDIGLQKTGYISEAGQCLVMQTRIAGRKLIMVFLDSAGKLSRLGDAERVRRWVETSPLIVRKISEAQAGQLIGG
jgi:hypothetical protein